MAALGLACSALGLVVTDPVGAAKAGLAHLAALAAVQPVGLQVLAPPIAHGLAGGAHALAIVAVLAGLVAPLATLAAVVLFA